MCKFKIGDWVYYRNELIGNVEKVDKNEILVSGQWHIKNSQFLKLWQPKEGEWCWFKDDKNTIGSLTKFVGIEEDGTYYGYASFGTQDKAPCVEPFIGELPSFIKDTE